MAAQTLRIAREHDTARAIPRKINFTVQALATLPRPPEGKRTVVYDSRTPRLQFVLTSTGASAFYWYGRANGRPVRHRLGDGAELTIEQARRLADETYGKVVRGIDPQQQRREDRAEWTFRHLFDWYRDNWAKPRKRTWQRDQDYFDNELSTLAPRRFSTITRGDVAKVHAEIGAKRPYAANRVLALIGSIYSRAAAALDYDGPNPARGVRKFPEQQRERFLQADELPRFFKALRAEEQLWQDYFTLLLLTGGRRNNTAAMRWAEVNLKEKTWTIPAEKFKTNRAVTVALMPDAVAILKRRHQEQQDDEKRGPSEYVFPSRNVAGKLPHLAEPKGAWLRVCKRAGLKDLRMHDLRRTLGSWMAAGGASLQMIGRQLGHRSIATTAIYSRLNVDPVREHVGSAVSAMMKAGKKRRGAK